MVHEDPHGHRFLGSDVEAPQFGALSRQGSGAYKGLETFDNPGCVSVTYSSDEVVSACPVTGQPDYYVCKIMLVNSPKLIESKSMKLWFNSMHEAAIRGNFGIFCEALAVHIRDQIVQVTGAEEQDVRVTLTQKSRGGISIEAVVWA